MSSTTTITCGNNRLQLTGKETPFGDWRDDLIRDGYAVVKNAIPRERADGYAEDMYSWLEGFGLGFDRNDMTTANEKHLPIINEKGMCWWYSLAHEDFVWQMRAEPGVVAAFEKVYDTKDLIDQNPDTQGFRCLQGLVNLLPNGPNDGGLIVCKGGHLLSEQFHAEMKHEERIKGLFHEWYGYTEAGMKWLADHGLKWEKICAEPGDLIVWDSRTPHYNLPSTSGDPRFCIYTCYMPVADVSQEDLKRKKDAFETFRTTSHWPNANFLGGRDATRDGKPCPYNRHQPVKLPKLDERGYKLTGIPYIQ